MPISAGSSRSFTSVKGASAPSRRLRKKPTVPTAEEVRHSSATAPPASRAVNEVTIAGVTLTFQR